LKPNIFNSTDKTPKDPTVNETPTTTTASTTSSLQRKKPISPALEPASSKPPVDDSHSRNVRLHQQRPVATTTAKTNPTPNNNNHIANKRLVPSIDVCVNQTLSEFTVEQIRSDISNRNYVATDAVTTVHRINGNGLASATEMASEEFLTSSLTFVSPRKQRGIKTIPRVKTPRDVELSPVRVKRTPVSYNYFFLIRILLIIFLYLNFQSASPKQSPKHISSSGTTSAKTSPKLEKDKSSKRKSNLNRAMHEGVLGNDGK
jgi:hypothetical protein